MNNKKDLCVICGAKSPYFMSTPIYSRFGYVEGAGQGCFMSDPNGYNCKNRETERFNKLHLNK